MRGAWDGGIGGVKIVCVRWPYCARKPVSISERDLEELPWFQT